MTVFECPTISCPCNVNAGTRNTLAECPELIAAIGPTVVDGLLTATSPEDWIVEETPEEKIGEFTIGPGIAIRPNVESPTVQFIGRVTRR